jgi:hypothetical protein
VRNQLTLFEGNVTNTDDTPTPDKEEVSIRDIDATDAEWFFKYPDQTEYVRALTFEEMDKFPENHFIWKPLHRSQWWRMHVKKLGWADGSMTIEKRLIICRDKPELYPEG